jgi:hypothetical protein
MRQWSTKPLGLIEDISIDQIYQLIRATQRVAQLATFMSAAWPA